jgi:hypothetical protein
MINSLNVLKRMVLQLHLLYLHKKNDVLIMQDVGFFFIIAGFLPVEVADIVKQRARELRARDASENSTADTGTAVARCFAVFVSASTQVIFIRVHNQSTTPEFRGLDTL